jgi:hypothetical protein
MPNCRMIDCGMSARLRRTIIACVAAHATFGTAPCAAQSPSATTAQAYPNRAIRMIVAIGAGGGTDVTARIVSQKLSEHFDHQKNCGPGLNNIHLVITLT